MPTNHPDLMYRLRPSARYCSLPDGKAAIVLRYPLRVVFVHDLWIPVVACLGEGEWVPFTRIATATPDIPAEQIESFLNTLTQKGYAAQKGFALLDERAYQTVSIIIPVRNRPQEIADCLRSLAGLDYPPEKLEIIVVDDASEDDTREKVRPFPGVCLLEMQQRRQASVCRNQGAELAKGDILAFIDSDCQADPSWLRELVPAFRDASLGAVGGWIDAAYEQNGLDRYEKVKSALKMGSWFKRSEQTERFFYVPACNFLVRKEIFTRLDGFNKTLHVGEDVDLCWRLQDAGYTLEYRPMGRVAHKHRNQLFRFCARRFDYGTSEPILQKLHPHRVKSLYLPWPESLFWLAVMLSLVFKTSFPFFLGVGLLLVDGGLKYRQLNGREIPVTRFQVYAAIIRGYLSFVYHCCSFISRYYLVAVPVMSLLSPLAALLMVGMHLTAGIIEYTVKKPSLNLFSFLSFFTMEQASYQSGVWWQCLRQLNFKPLLPRIVQKKI